MQLHVLSGVIYFGYGHWNRHRKKRICICTGVHQSLIGLCFLSGVMNWEVVIQLQENSAAVRFRSGLEGSPNNLHTNIGIITYINTVYRVFFFTPPKNLISNEVGGNLKKNKTLQKTKSTSNFCFYTWYHPSDVMEEEKGGKDRKDWW